MSFFADDARRALVIASSAPLKTPRLLRLRSRLMLYLLPGVLAILSVTGWVSYRISDDYIHIGVERLTRVFTMAMAHALEQDLERCRVTLLAAARQNLDASSMRTVLDVQHQLHGMPYLEFGLLLPEDGHVLLLSDGNATLSLPRERLSEIRGNPMLFYHKIKDLRPGEVYITRIEETEYPFPAPGNPAARFSAHVIRFFTPYVSEDGQRRGFIFLALDARHLRNILSAYNSPESPVAAFPRSAELRYAYFFDTEGWMLFQSETNPRAEAELATDQARSGYTGSLGRSDLRGAFRPSPSYGNYWRMVGDIAEGRANLINLLHAELPPDAEGEYFLSYAPVRFPPGAKNESTVIGGVAYLDRSRLPHRAGYEHFDTMLFVMLLSMLFIASVMYFAGAAATRSLLDLAAAVRSMRFRERLEPLALRGRSFEAQTLVDAVNHLVGVINGQLEMLRIKDMAIESAGQKEEADLSQEAPDLADALDESIVPGIVGRGYRMDAWRSEILKAARANVDVLITGQTGTGKQLAAEAVHRLSERREQPFISINCGALDENLLLDTLFGHVKGAFTEAKTDRKGAFQEAHGGVLFLDEVQSASPKVQLSLLRALSMRKVKPLGSDMELDVDVRLIAATNVDLMEAVKINIFREDLYYRLKVITIHTPSLKEHPENIPALAFYYLKKAEKLVKKDRVAFSKGALDKLKRHDWPGNVRELKNVVTRAVVMAEGSLILADDILLEEGPPRLAVSNEAPGDAAASAARATPADVKTSLPQGLNARQARALPVILERGEITRAEYERLVGEEVPRRTAAYDLKDLVKRGLLIKAGNGPATRYLLAADRRDQ